MTSSTGVGVKILSSSSSIRFSSASSMSSLSPADFDSSVKVSKQIKSIYTARILYSTKKHVYCTVGATCMDEIELAYQYVPGWRAGTSGRGLICKGAGVTKLSVYYYCGTARLFVVTFLEHTLSESSAISSRYSRRWKVQMIFSRIVFSLFSPPSHAASGVAI